MIKTQYKQTEIGVIPEDWEVTTLEEISLEITDGSHFSPRESPEGDKIIATVKDMRYNQFSFENCKRILNEDFNRLVKDGCSPERGDILISKDGANCLDLIFVYNHDEKIVILSSIAIVRLKPGFNSQFYRYYLLSPVVQEMMREGYVSGSAIPRVVLKDLKKVPVPLLNIETQDRIANILCSLDDKIELNYQMNKNLEAISKAIFKHWFVDFEFPNEKGKPYKSSGGKMVYNEELGKEIPKEWKLKTINEVVTVKGGSTPSTTNLEYWDDGRINWCTPKDLSKLDSPILLKTERKITKKGLATISSNLLPVGTVLLSSRAPIGYLAISEIPVAVNQGFIAIVCDKVISKYFLLFWLHHNMDIIKSMAHGTTFEEINKTSFRKINILVPSQKILNDFDSLIQPLYRKSVKNEKERNILSHLREFLLPKLMSGKIRVPVEAR